MWSFLIVDVHTPVLGADFLVHHGLINVENRKLLDVDTYQTALLPNQSGLNGCSIITEDLYGHLIDDFSEVFQPELI